MNITAFYGDVAVEYEQPQIPIDKPLWYIVPGVGRAYVPLTCQFRPEHVGLFEPDMQIFVFSLNRSENEARDRMAFQGYRDTFNTIGHKINLHYNAVTDEGDPNNLPTVEFNIGFSANVVSGTPGYVNGVEVLWLETIDVNKPLPYGFSYETHPWLIHHQVITIYERRNPFIQMGGKSIAPYRPCFTPFWSKVPMYMPMAKLSKVVDGKIPNPYNPAWDYLGGD